MVSIVLPTYNGEKYLREAITSILIQTYEDFELIIVDDCSTDDTAEIIKDFMSSDSRVQYFRNNSNKKLPASLNVGFSLAKGDYFTWTSDDNVYYKDALAVMAHELDERPDVDLVFAREDIIDECGRNLGPMPLRENLDEMYSSNIMTPCFLYRAKIHDALNGYDESKFLIEDYDFWRRAYRRYKFKYIPQRLYGYRVHGDSLTSTRFVDVRLNKIKLLEESIDQDNLGEKINSSMTREISNTYIEIAQYYADQVLKYDKSEINKLSVYSISKQIRGFLRGIKRRFI